MTKTLTKADLAERMATAAFMSKADANRALDAAIAAILSATGQGAKVRLHGFGTFELRRMAGRTGRNPQTGAPVEIAPSERLAFRAGSAAKLRGV
ncbi:MAG: HU family DNA-binding protein [Gemmobacter sp.]